jgi:carboxyl-terminal processing protease
MKRLLLASALTLVLSQTLFSKEEIVVPEQSRFESLSKLTKVIGTVEKYYVDDIKLQEIVDKSLKANARVRCSLKLF